MTQPIPIPPEVAYVEGCDCKGGNWGGFARIHLVTCAVHQLSGEEYERRHDEAWERVRAYVAKLAAQQAATGAGLPRWKVGDPPGEYTIVLETCPARRAHGRARVHPDGSITVTGVHDPKLGCCEEG